MEVGGPRKLGRPKLRWRGAILKDLKEKGVQTQDKIIEEWKLDCQLQIEKGILVGCNNNFAILTTKFDKEELISAQFVMGVEEE